jgi:stress response protein YsnF
MASDSALPPVIGAIADDRDGNALGTITAVFLDDVTRRPTWVGLTDELHAGPGGVPVIAPIQDADFSDGRLRLAVTADDVRTAPRALYPDRLTPDEETVLREHYRHSSARAATGTRTATDTVTIPAAEPAPRTTPDPAAGTATDGAMTRSEEQLAVSTVVEPWARAVLRIEEVTEEVMVPVTITRQQARIEYLPLSRTGDVPTGRDLAPAGAARPTSTSGWVTLYAEQPAVTLERRPVERVRLSTEWATGEVAVSGQLRREQIELTETPGQ